MKQKPSTPEPRASRGTGSFAFGKDNELRLQPPPGPAVASCAFPGDVNIHFQRGCGPGEARGRGCAARGRGTRSSGTRGCCRALPAQRSSRLRHRGLLTSRSGGKANLWLPRFAQQAGVCGGGLLSRVLVRCWDSKKKHLSLWIVSLPLPHLSEAIGVPAKERKRPTREVLALKRDQKSLQTHRSSNLFKW